MKSLALIFFLCIGSAGFGQSDSTLFGLHRDMDTQEFWFSSLEPSTGEITLISENPLGHIIAINPLATIDPFERIYYFASSDSLFGADIQSGEVVSKTLIDLPGNKRLDFLQFNEADSLVYGLARTPNVVPLSTEFVLVTIDPPTGQVMELSSTPLQEMFSVFGMAAINPIDMKVYLVNWEKHIVGFDMVTGEPLASVPLDIPADTHLDFLRFNYVDETFYGVRRHPAGEGYYLCTVDPATGEVIPLSEDPFWENHLMGNPLGTIDPSNGIFYVTAAPTEFPGGYLLLGMDLATGEKIVETTILSEIGNVLDLTVYFPDICPRERLMVLHTEEELAVGFNLYPNPAKNSAVLEFPDGVGQVTYRVIDLLGVQVAAGQVHQSRTPIDVSAFPRGMYLVSVSGENGHGTRRLVVE